MISLRSPNAETSYPEEPVYLPPVIISRIVLTRDPDGEERCVACNLCAVACPVSCISLQRNQDGRWYPEFFRINYSAAFSWSVRRAVRPRRFELTPDFEMGNTSARIWI